MFAGVSPVMPPTPGGGGGTPAAGEPPQAAPAVEAEAAEADAWIRYEEIVNSVENTDHIPIMLLIGIARVEIPALASELLRALADVFEENTNALNSANFEAFITFVISMLDAHGRPDAMIAEIGLSVLAPIAFLFQCALESTVPVMHSVFTMMEVHPDNKGVQVNGARIISEAIQGPSGPSVLPTRRVKRRAVARLQAALGCFPEDTEDWVIPALEQLDEDA